MRRQKCEVTDSFEIERILGLARVGRLATMGLDGYPYITPVNFVYFDGDIYFHSAPVGEKLDNLKADPHVCFEVDIPLAYLDSGFDPDGGICRLHQLYHCVIIRGRAGVVEDDQLKAECLNKLVSKYEERVIHQQAPHDFPGFSGCVVVGIKPTSISAKTDLYQYKSAEIRRKLVEYLSARGMPDDAQTVELLTRGLGET